MAYVNVTDFIGSSGYLNQVDAADPNNLTKATAVIARAEKIVNGVLEFEFAGFANEERAVRSQYGPYFPLPAHDPGSVSKVTTTGGTEITDFEEKNNGILYAVNSDGYEFNWNAARYLITADWGYGDPTDDVKEIVLEVAVNIWRSAESGRFTNVVGAVDGGSVGYESALTPFQKMVLKDIRNSWVPIVI